MTTDIQPKRKTTTTTTTTTTATAAVVIPVVVVAKRSAQKMKLPVDFEPGKYSVVCGRGKLSSANPGNKHLRVLVKQNLTHYSNAKTKSEKSGIVSSIMKHVREISPEGAFVKKEDNGEWWEVDDSFAREKIGCIFRDILHTQYRSSTKAKHARKKAQEKRNAPSRSPSLFPQEVGSFVNSYERWNEVVSNLGSMWPSMPDQRSLHLEGGNVVAAGGSPILRSIGNIRGGVRRFGIGSEEQQARSLQQNMVLDSTSPLSGAMFSPMMPTGGATPFGVQHHPSLYGNCRSVSPNESQKYSSPTTTTPSVVNSLLQVTKPITWPHHTTATTTTSPQQTGGLLVGPPQSEYQKAFSFILNGTSSSPSLVRLENDNKNANTLSLIEEALNVVNIDGVGDEDLLISDDISDIFDDDDDDNEEDNNSLCSVWW